MHFAIYQDDNSLAGDSGDVSAQFEDPGIDGTWANVPLSAPIVTTGPGVWIGALQTIAAGPKLAFCNTSGGEEIPGWLLNPSSHYTCVRTEGFADLPSTIAPFAGIPYIDQLIGVY